MKLGLFKLKDVRGLYAYEHFEAPNGMWVQLRVGTGPIRASNEAVFSYGAEDVRPHVRFDRWEKLVAFVEALPD